MKYLNKLATVCCSAAIGLMALTSCEGGDLYGIDSPDWISSRVDSIANSKNNNNDEPVIEGLHEDVYSICKEDLSSGFWTLGKTYVVPAGAKWQAQFNLTVNPDNVYYKNCYIVFNDYNPDTDDHLGTEYGVIRFDNDPSKNSEWGDNIDRSLVKADFENSSDNDAETDPSVQKMNGKVTITVDRTQGGVHYTITNGTLTKEYIQPYDFPMNNPEGRICCRFGIEKAIINFQGSTIEPIGGYTSKEDKQPLSMEISGLPSEILVGTTLEEAVANVTGTVYFEQGVVKSVTAKDLTFQAIPNMEDLGQKTLVAIYNKTFKGEACNSPVAAVKIFSVVNELSAFTQTVVVPNPIVLGAEDNSQAWWTAHTENIKVEPKETKVVNFTNYTNGENNWNNFVIVLNKADVSQEYAVVRADNWGWGAGYDGNPNLKAIGTQGDWDSWRAAMNGAKVTAYITNNGDGSADIKAVMIGNNGVEYVQEYSGISTIDPDDMYFRFTVDACHLVFDTELGTPDCATPWWTAFTPNVQIKAHQVCTVNFTNYTSGGANWNNFVIILNRADLSEYAVVRADNWGWGAGYDGNPNLQAIGTQGDWPTWLGAMNGAKCTAQIVNNGNGTADIRILMHGTDGVDYTQDYIGINSIDPDDFFFRFTVDGSYLVFE